MDIKCNVESCLRKYTTYSYKGSCSVSYADEKHVMPNSEDCSLYCDKYWDYRLKKEINKVEEVDYISSDLKDKFNKSWTHGMFAGLSKKGRELSELEEKFENKHEYENKIICPYCDYEMEDCDSDYTYEDDYEVECCECGKTFRLNPCVSISYTTSKMEEFEDSEEYKEFMGSLKNK